jgi:hypothetical protein
MVDLQLPRRLTIGALALACAWPLAATAQLAPVAEGPVVDSLRGRSGQLRVRLLGGGRDGTIRILQEMFGEEAATKPGVYEAPQESTAPFAFIHMLPFKVKNAGRIGPYRVGSWPDERRPVSNAELPEGFIEITEQNQETRVSEHFRLRDFLTHDQQNVWPKYLVLREALVDKLELVIADLRDRGFTVGHMVVMSGFRTPQYNKGGRGGRATDSRHQYGDAADIFVDGNRDGRMDDLNRDGRVDSRDARVILESVERVERAHPAIVGGASVYRATRKHGPFLHVDVRGTRARWG